MQFSEMVDGLVAEARRLGLKVKVKKQTDQSVELGLKGEALQQFRLRQFWTAHEDRHVSGSTYSLGPLAEPEPEPKPKPRPRPKLKPTPVVRKKAIRKRRRYT